MTDSTSQPSEPTSERTPERGSFLSTALLWRLLAVGLFVVLGTFAVIQSLNREQDPHVHGEGEQVAGAIDSVTGAAVAGVESTKNKFGEAGAATSGLASKATDALKSVTSTSIVDADTIAGMRKLAVVGVSKRIKAQPTISTAGFQQPATKLPPIKNQLTSSSPTTRRNTIDTSFTPRKTPPIVAAKPATQQGFQANAIRKQPPERLAQLNGTTSGFNPRATMQQSATNLGNTIQGATSRAGDTLSGLKTGAKNATNDLLTRAKEGANNALGGAREKASGLVGNIRAVEAKPPAGMAVPTNPFSAKSGAPTTMRTQTDSPFKTNSGSAMKPISQAGSTTTPSTNNPFSKLGGTARPGANDTPRNNTSPFAPRATTNNSTPAVRNNTGQTRPATPRNNGLTNGNGFNGNRNNFNNTAQPSKQDDRLRSNVNSAAARTTPFGNAASKPIASVAAMNIPGDKAFEGVQAPSLTIEKVSPREIQINQTADFEIIVKNVGRVVADDVRVLDKVPAGTNYMGSSPEPSSMTRAGDLQWSLGTLRPGQEKRLRYKLKPTQPGEIGSVAQVVFATRASMRTVVTKPVLEIRHSTNPRVMIGDNVVFDVIVENKGDGPANDVLIQEEVPANLEFSDGSPEIEFEIGTLMPGQSRRVQLGLKAAKVGKLRNVMFASAKGGLRAQHELDMEVVSPALKVTSEGPTRRFIQRQATHRFTIQNGGTAKATNVEMFARLPSGLRFVSANNRGKYDSNTHSVVWVMPELSQGVAGSVDVTTMPVESGEQNIKFESFADLGLKAETKQLLAVEHLIDVFFDIDDVIDPIEIGADTKYKIRVVNQGTETAANVQLQVDMPPGLQPIEVEGSLRNQIQGQRVTFEPISTMRPGDELSVTVRATGKSAGDHRVVVNMTTDGRTAPVSKEETTRVYSDR